MQQPDRGLAAVWKRLACHGPLHRRAKQTTQGDHETTIAHSLRQPDYTIDRALCRFDRTRYRTAKQVTGVLPLHRGGPVTRSSHERTSQTGRSWLGLLFRLTARAAISPRLAIDLWRTAWAFRARDWHRSAPFLPLPPKEYVRWRMDTAYGDERAVPSVEDVIRFARWRREVMHL